MNPPSGILVMIKTVVTVLSLLTLLSVSFSILAGILFVSTATHYRRGDACRGRQRAQLLCLARA
jgi:hypothetical protein